MSFFFFKKKTFMKFFYHFRKLVQIIWKRNILKKKEEEEERKMVEMISRIFCHFQETNSLWSRRFHLTIFFVISLCKRNILKEKERKKNGRNDFTIFLYIFQWFDDPWGSASYGRYWNRGKTNCWCLSWRLGGLA